MNLYKLTQDVKGNYDTYDSIVVAADTHHEAKLIHPNETYVWAKGGWNWVDSEGKLRPENPTFKGEWTEPFNVKSELIGFARPGTKAGVIHRSFNAG